MRKYTSQSVRYVEKKLFKLIIVSVQQLSANLMILEYIHFTEILACQNGLKQTHNKTELQHARKRKASTEEDSGDCHSGTCKFTQYQKKKIPQKLLFL